MTLLCFYALYQMHKNNEQIDGLETQTHKNNEQIDVLETQSKRQLKLIESKQATINKLNQKLDLLERVGQRQGSAGWKQKLAAHRKFAESQAESLRGVSQRRIGRLGLGA